MCVPYDPEPEETEPQHFGGEGPWTYMASRQALVDLGHKLSAFAPGDALQERLDCSFLTQVVVDEGVLPAPVCEPRLLRGVHWVVVILKVGDDLSLQSS